MIWERLGVRVRNSELRRGGPGLEVIGCGDGEGAERAGFTMLP